MEQVRSLLENKKIQKWFCKDNLIILILAGLLLLVINLPTDDADITFTDNKKENSESPIKWQEETKYKELYEYAEYLEEKLESILVNMKGIGKVEVMITLETSEEQIVEKDQPILQDETTETDNAGGNRVVKKSESGQETVFMKEGNQEIPYVSKTLLPKISGVLILAQGAGQGNNSKSISEIAQALFAVEAHKVKVVIME